MWTNPEMTKKMEEEIKEHIPDIRNITPDQIKKLEYMQCFLDECMRYSYDELWYFPREAVNDTFLGGVKIKKNTVVTAIPWPLFRSEKNFKRANEFIPERWDKKNPEWAEESQKRNPFQYLPFAAGPKNCIGQHYFWLEIKIMVAVFLHHYNLKYPENMRNCSWTQKFCLEPVEGYHPEIEYVGPKW